MTHERTKGRSLLILTMTLIMAGVFALAMTLSAQDAYGAETEINNGIPVLSLTIDEAEFQKVIESEDHSYRAPGASISFIRRQGYREEGSEEG